MAKRKLKPVTPKSVIISALRRLWMFSRERREALKRDKNTCQRCGVKQSKAKGREQVVVVHHLEPADLTWLAEQIRGKLLHTHDKLKTLCPECHDIEHGK